MTNKLCICCSGKAFSQCCEPLLQRNKSAKTPVQLMRSRYAAFALGGHGDYLLDTWWPAARDGLSQAELSLRSIDWVSLEIVTKSQAGNNGFVEFKAYFNDSESNESLVHHERSTFQRLNGCWLYVSGEIS